MEWIWLEAGCAECGDAPLVGARGVYATEAEAKDAAGWSSRWESHPQGGWIYQSGSGANWIAPLSALHDRERHVGERLYI